jgi:hypothetical protein
MGRAETVGDCELPLGGTAATHLRHALPHSQPGTGRAR